MESTNLKSVSDLNIGDRVKFLEDFPTPDPIMSADFEHTVKKDSIGTVEGVHPDREHAVVGVEIQGEYHRVIVYEQESTRSGDTRDRLDKLYLL